jgi:hypothetical protein
VPVSATVTTIVELVSDAITRCCGELARPVPRCTTIRCPTAKRRSVVGTWSVVPELAAVVTAWSA